MKMYLNITKTCLATVFLLHLTILLQNVYITTLCRGKRAIFLFFIFLNGLTVVLSQLANSWERMDILLIMNLKQDFRLLTLFVI